MGDRQHSPARRARVDAWRRAWFDGWTEGVIWTLARTKFACVKAVTLRLSVAGVTRHKAAHFGLRDLLFQAAQSEHSRCASDIRSEALEQPNQAVQLG